MTARRQLITEHTRFFLRCSLFFFDFFIITKKKDIFSLKFENVASGSATWIQNTNSFLILSFSPSCCLLSSSSYLNSQRRLVLDCLAISFTFHTLLLCIEFVWNRKETMIFFNEINYRLLHSDARTDKRMRVKEEQNKRYSNPVKEERKGKKRFEWDA